MRLFCVSLQKELRLCFITELVFKPSLLFLLDCFSFVYCSLTPLISNCLSLLFRTQGKPRRLKPFSTNKKQGTLKPFAPWRAHKVLLGYSLFSLILFNLEGEQKKGNAVLDREINHKLRKGTQL